MKIRKGFVSNSSSSSFVVIGHGDLEVNHLRQFVDGDDLLVGIRGVTEFGWEVTYYKDMWDRINFAYLQALASGHELWVDMLELILKKHFRCDKIVYMITDDWQGSTNEYGEVKYGYIDHGSSASEGENIEMFASSSALERFLFCSDSYIRGDNDNH